MHAYLIFKLLEIINEGKLFILLVGLLLLWLIQPFNLGFKETDGKLFFDRALSEQDHIVGIFETKDRACVACGKLARCNEGENGIGEIEKSCGVCNCAAAFADLKRKLLLGHIILLGEGSVCHSLFNRVKVFPLNIFDKRDLRGLSIVTVENDSGYLG